MNIDKVGNVVSWVAILGTGVAICFLLFGCAVYREITPATMGDLDRIAEQLNDQHDATWEEVDDAATAALLAGSPPGEAALAGIKHGKDFAAETEITKEEGGYGELIMWVLGVLGVGGLGTGIRYKQKTGDIPFASVLTSLFSPTPPSNPKAPAKKTKR